LLPLIIPSGNIAATAPDRVPEVPHPGRSVEPYPTADGLTSDRKFTVSATIKLLRVVRDFANGFGPLKSVAGCLCLILENCEVWRPCHRAICNDYSFPPQKTEVDEQAIELLAPQVKTLSESLCVPIPLGDINEREREQKLTQSAHTLGLRAESDTWKLLGNWNISVRV